MASTPDAPWVGAGRVPCLDGYRGIGTLFIVFSHSMIGERTSFPALGPLHEFVPWGMIAVHHFFVLSGFLITLLLLREWNSQGRISLKSFYRRRILRLMPTYLAFLSVVYCLHLAGVVVISSEAWFGALTYSINFHLSRTIGWELGHFWTLALEEHFYLVWPVILAFLGLRGGRWAIVACILFAPVFHYVSEVYWSDYINAEFCTFSNVDFIAFGAGLAFVCQSEAFRRHTLRFQPICGWLFVGVCVGLIGSAWLAQRSWRYDLVAHRTVTGFLCAAVIYVSISFSNEWVTCVLEWRPLMRIGMVSYSIYVWQQLFVGKSALPSWFTTWPTNILCVATVGLLSYFIIERPFMRIKERGGRGIRLLPKKSLVDSSRQIECVQS